jgi:hypothetical protein
MRANRQPAGGASLEIVFRPDVVAVAVDCNGETMSAFERCGRTPRHAAATVLREELANAGLERRVADHWLASGAAALCRHGRGGADRDDRGTPRPRQHAPDRFVLVHTRSLGNGGSLTSISAGVKKASVPGTAELRRLLHYKNGSGRKPPQREALVGGAGALARGENFSKRPGSAISFSIASISIGTKAERFS